MAATVIISRLADNHNLEDPKSEASKIIIDDMLPKLDKKNLDYVFFGQFNTEPGNTEPGTKTKFRFGIILIGWKDKEPVAVNTKEG